MRDITSWSNRIHDRRGKRVLFLAHCLLNENTRYLGGACQSGGIREIIAPCLDQGIGVVQMPCPEQHAWGGVLKRRLLLFYGSAGTLPYRLRNALLPPMLWYTRQIYRGIAQGTADQILDYQRSGMTVVGIIGVDGSPSCGVHKSLDMRAALEGLGQLNRETATAEDANQAIRSTVTPGRGLYIEALQRGLHRRGLTIPFTAHDLVGELEGRPSSVDVSALTADRS